MPFYGWRFRVVFHSKGIPPSFAIACPISRMTVVFVVISTSGIGVCVRGRNPHSGLDAAGKPQGKNIVHNSKGIPPSYAIATPAKKRDRNDNEDEKDNKLCNSNV